MVRDAGSAAAAERNEVLLVGRLAAGAERRELPSGDALVQFRLSVARPANAVRRQPARSPTVDTLPCVTWQSGVQRRILSWSEGDIVEVQGALRRRFWRSAGSVGSRVEVDVTGARRVARS